MIDEESKQHDDHIWLKVHGETWAIFAKRGNLLKLWRGYWPHLDWLGIELVDFDYDLYCSTAVEMLEKEWGPLK